MPRNYLANYIVNYGVNARHLFEGEPFEFYRDAKEFYNGLDREKWGAANIVKVESAGKFAPANIIKKDEYIVR